MKKQILLISLISTSAFTSSVVAEKKAAVRIDFNKMIDENDLKKNELHKEVTSAAQGNPKVAKARKVNKMDKAKVIDFIDVEIGVGQAPTLTDRRFDSVGEPHVVDLTTLVK